MISKETQDESNEIYFSGEKRFRDMEVIFDFSNGNICIFKWQHCGTFFF